MFDETFLQRKLNTDESDQNFGLIRKKKSNTFTQNFNSNSNIDIYFLCIPVIAYHDPTVKTLHSSSCPTRYSKTVAS